jgi:hypothetical protein
MWLAAISFTRYSTACFVGSFCILRVNPVLPVLALLSDHGMLHYRRDAQLFLHPQLLSITKHNASIANGNSSVSERSSERTVTTELWLTHSHKIIVRWKIRRIDSLQFNLDKFWFLPVSCKCFNFGLTEYSERYRHVKGMVSLQITPEG